MPGAGGETEEETVTGRGSEPTRRHDRQTDSPLGTGHPKMNATDMMAYEHEKEQRPTEWLDGALSRLWSTYRQQFTAASGGLLSVTYLATKTNRHRMTHPGEGQGMDLTSRKIPPMGGIPLPVK